MIQIPETFERGSKFSDDGKYRYMLYRRWSEATPMVFFICLNPSIADDKVDDPTQLRMRHFAQGWGYGGYFVGNLFALVSTDPKGLDKIHDPVGLPENDWWLTFMQSQSAKTIAAWGCQGGRGSIIHRRAAKVAYNMRQLRDLYCLVTTTDGCPRHPLYLKGNLQPVLYTKGR